MHDQPRLPDDAEAELRRLPRRALRTPARSACGPGWDDKVLADWNGLMIAALAKAAPVFERARLARRSPTDAFAFVTARDDGRGRPAVAQLARRARRNHPAIARRLRQSLPRRARLHEATGEAAYLAQAEAWVGVCSTATTGIAAAAAISSPPTIPTTLILRTKTATDAAMPSGNGTMVGVLARLYYLTGKTRLSRARRRAGRGLRRRGRSATSSRSRRCSTATSCCSAALQIVIIGDRDDAATAALLRAVHGRSPAQPILSVVAPGDALPAGHPAAGKTAVGGHATAYVCRGPGLLAADHRSGRPRPVARVAAHWRASEAPLRR